VNLRVLRIALAGCLLWLLLLPVGTDKPDVAGIDAPALTQVWLDDGLADDQPDFVPPSEAVTRPNDREGVSAGLEPGGHVIGATGDQTANAGFRRISRSGPPVDTPSVFLLRNTRSPRAPPA
jgi:hypothetical protein